ncbi:MAG TPA: crosslink repair DNA glycosylase YcaQ family protein [Candidatus Limnocylindria bacterium]|nr:crosslink repair DNA glycosylase YcaQ family protein [Candidatus Limnocylindria bacterium]
MPDPIAPQLELSADHARRFLVSRHLLAPPRALAPEAASVLTVVERLGLLQFDPLEVPGARNHDLVLHARISGYRRGWAEEWLYGADRRLIELYNKSLNILPMDQLPHYAIAWDRAGNYYSDRILAEQSQVADAILEAIRREGPLATSAFKEHGHAVDWWWAPTSAARAVMEALFVSGRLGIARRDGNRRYYDLIERVVPADLLARRESEEDALRMRLLSRYRAVGLLGAQGPADVVYSTGTAAQRATWTAQLVADGTLLPVAVEGLRGIRLLLADEEPMLEATRDPASVPPAVTFMAPLDPLIWDRRLLRDLFGFDYTWEVYTPAAKRRHGYYVLPLLYGERLVGRIEPRLERKTGTLRMLGVWFEPDFRPMEEPHFVPALARALDAYTSFIGARRITWPRTRAGRELAAALRAS